MKFCCICLSNCTKESSIDSCNHKFCFECIKKWSSFATTCPLCRKKYSYISFKEKKKNEKYFIEKKVKNFNDERTRRISNMIYFQNKINEKCLNMMKNNNDDEKNRKILKMINFKNKINKKLLNMIDINDERNLNIVNSQMQIGRQICWDVQLKNSMDDLAKNAEMGIISRLINK